MDDTGTEKRGDQSVTSQLSASPSMNRRTPSAASNDVLENTLPYDRASKAAEASVTFVASRLKLTVAPILLAPFVLFPIPFLRLTIRPVEQGQSVAPALLVFGAMILAAAGLEIFLTLSAIFPQRIVLTTDGWSTSSFGRSTFYKWSDFQEPKEGRVSNGRSLQPCIRIERKAGGKPVVLLSRAYPISLDDLVQAFRLARNGNLIDPDDAKLPWAYLFAWIPLALATVITAVSWLGPQVVHRIS